MLLLISSVCKTIKAIFCLTIDIYFHKKVSDVNALVKCKIKQLTISVFNFISDPRPVVSRRKQVEVSGPIEN